MYDLCLNQCYLSENIKVCNCTDPTIEISVFDAHKCQSVKEIECVIDYYKYNFTVNSKFLNDYCLPLCPLECNSTGLNAFVSAVNLDGDKSYDLIRKSQVLSSQFNGRPLNTETALKSFVRLVVNYETLSYELTTESAKMEIVDLLANVGGNLGLFMGVSVLSLCEILQAFIEIFLI
jgi:hypothetical protein